MRPCSRRASTRRAIVRPATRAVPRRAAARVRTRGPRRARASPSCDRRHSSAARAERPRSGARSRSRRPDASATAHPRGGGSRSQYHSRARLRCVSARHVSAYMPPSGCGCKSEPLARCLDGPLWSCRICAGTRSRLLAFVRDYLRHSAGAWCARLATCLIAHRASDAASCAATAGGDAAVVGVAWATPTCVSLPTPGRGRVTAAREHDVCAATATSHDHVAGQRHRPLEAPLAAANLTASVVL